MAYWHTISLFPLVNYLLFLPCSKKAERWKLWNLSWRALERTSRLIYYYHNDIEPGNKSRWRGASSWCLIEFISYFCLTIESQQSTEPIRIWGSHCQAKDKGHRTATGSHQGRARQSKAWVCCNQYSMIKIVLKLVDVLIPTENHEIYVCNHHLVLIPVCIYPP